METKELNCTGRQSPHIKRKSAKLKYDGVKLKEKKLLIIPRRRHSILANEESDEVFEAVFRFIGDYERVRFYTISAA